jgi:cytochrome b pre-mRNA-processing protein 3
MLNILRRAAGEKRIAERLYHAIAKRAREPLFYRDLGVADTFDGRFDLLILHGWLVADALKSRGLADLENRLVEAMFSGFEEALRDQGVGDVGVSRRSKAITSALFGRLKAYGAAADEEAFVQALLRNLYRDANGREDCARRVAHYIAESRRALENQDLTEEEPAFALLPEAMEKTR